MIENVTLGQYVSALLDSQRVENPTREQLRAICPHISENQMEATLLRGHDISLPAPKGKGFVARYFPGYTQEDVSFLEVVPVDSKLEEPALFWDEADAYAWWHWGSNSAI